MSPEEIKLRAQGQTVIFWTMTNGSKSWVYVQAVT